VSIRAGNTSTRGRTTSIHLSVTEAPPSASNSKGSGARDLRLFRNGSLVKIWRGDLDLVNGQTSVQAEIPVAAGENRFIAYAFNRDNVKSADAVLIVQSTAPKRAGTAYVLSIGINHYANSEFDLKYAAPDARRISETLRESLQRVGNYENIVNISLLDGQATKRNILLALATLAGGSGGELPPELSALQPSGPEDAVVVYFAGHGTADGDRFYLIPHDLGYSGPREKVHDSLGTVLAKSISDAELETAFEAVDASHVLLIIDACNSGKALDSDEQRRGPLNSKGLAQLAYEKGMYVLAAAQAYQAAMESARLGHGYLTYALAEEGLTRSAADVKPADGQITANEWFEYASRRVPQLQMEALQDAAAQKRLLVFDSTASPDAAVGRLQTPRLYYRRDDTTPALVVAKR
jgi:hypothetical protein